MPTPSTLPAVAYVPVLVCPPDCDALLAKAKLIGALNVVVRLDTSAQSASDLHTAHAALLAELNPYTNAIPGYGGVQPLIAYAPTPYLLLAADPITLPILFKAGHVMAVYEDVPGGETFGLGLTANDAPGLIDRVRTTGNQAPYSQPVSCPPRCDDLLIAAQAGTIPVIVTPKLAAPYYLAGDLVADPTKDAENAQKALIRLGEATLIAQLRAAHPTVKIGAVGLSMPSVALRVDSAALRWLIGSPWVVSIAPDSLSRPS